MRPRGISVARHSAPALRLQDVEEFEEVAAGSPFALFEARDRALLFEESQIELLEAIARGIECLHDSVVSKSNCHFVKPLKDVYSRPFLEILRSYAAFACNPRLTCCRCALRNGSALNVISPKSCDAASVVAALKPLRVPKTIGCQGNALSRADPFTIYEFDSSLGPMLLPLPDFSVAETMVSISAFIRSVREHERRTLKVPFSLRLSSVIDGRSAFAIASGINTGIATFAAYCSVGLTRSFPLLIDPLITEIFADKEGSFAYVDHQELGRLSTGVRFSRDELSRLINFAKMEAERCLDYSHPSLRASIKTSEFHVRVSVDNPPLSIEGTAVAIRKFSIKPLTMHDLISNGTLPAEAASYLEACVKQRKSITVYGESGSGKTTLAVALDLLTPRSWRKISVESDVAENVSQERFSMHQIRLLASGTSKTEQEKRTSILNSLLHKSPDYVFFGEVLSIEDSAALFQMLASGLKCIHTIHAESAEALLRRLVLQHRVQPGSITDLELLVQMQKVCEGDLIRRRVLRISLVGRRCNEGELPPICDIFHWSCALNRLERASEEKAGLCPGTLPEETHPSELG